MKFYYYLLLALVIFASCSAYKTANKEMDKGNYAEAFNASIKVFQKNYSQKKKDKQLVLLQNSYLKANEKDEIYLNQLRNSTNLNYKGIYYQIKRLYDRINTIKPFLPLYNGEKELKFPTKNYNLELATAKENYLNQYYTVALDLLSSNNKNNAREAYKYFSEVKGVDNYYKEVTSKQNEAYNKGADIVFVATQNQTGVPFPNNFNNNLLANLNSSVNDFWTYITTNSSDPRDYEVNIILRQAFVGRDILTSNTYHYEKEIIDGWEYLTDRRGNPVKDSLGNSIKVDKYIKVNARVTEFFRQKEAMLSADVQTYNSYTGSLMNTEPIATNFMFKASFATLEGDERAINNKDIIRLINTRPISFPNDYDMISQCGIELKSKIINILSRFN